MTRLPLAAALAALTFAACGGGGGAPSGGYTPPSAPQSSGSSGASGAGSAGPAAATVKLADYSLDPMTVSIHSGESILVVNVGKTPHNLWVRDASGKVVAKSPDLAPGQQATMKVDAPAGSYVDYCQEPGHESLGMKGTLTIG